MTARGKGIVGMAARRGPFFSLTSTTTPPPAAGAPTLALVLRLPPVIMDSCSAPPSFCAISLFYEYKLKLKKLRVTPRELLQENVFPHSPSPSGLRLSVVQLKAKVINRILRELAQRFSSALQRPCHIHCQINSNISKSSKSGVNLW